MKKLLLGSAAICGLALAAPTTASAEVDLELGGWFKGYGVFMDQDDSTAIEARDFDFVRQTEIHFSGETTLDNGLTVGAHIEAEADASGAGDNFTVEESYVYFSGAWGRVNFGAEDGAAYLLQVAAPSADDNIDGIRQYVQPVNYAAVGSTNLTAAAVAGDAGFDYEQDISGYADKLTYLTPVFSGFQAGVSYTPDATNAGELTGVSQDNSADGLGDIIDLAIRYEGMFDEVGVIFGGGYTMAENENNVAGAASINDDQTAWNVGLDLNFGPFGLGAVYKEDDNGEVANVDDEEIFVVGADYTTGPFKLGASYYDAENSLGVNNLDTTRYTGGVTYTYGPGMSFRGSVSYIEHEGVTIGAATRDVEATSVLLGTQISF